MAEHLEAQPHTRALEAGPRILAALVGKAIWEDGDQWTGFIKCCEMGKGAAVPVLLQLPEEQLEAVVKASAGVNKMLNTHYQTLNPNSGQAKALKKVMGPLEAEGP